LAVTHNPKPILRFKMSTFADTSVKLDIASHGHRLIFCCRQKMDANWPPLQFAQGCTDAERRITSSVIEALNAALCETNNNMALLTSKALAADSFLPPAPLQLKLTGLDLHFKRSFFATVLDG